MLPMFKRSGSNDRRGDNDVNAVDDNRFSTGNLDDTATACKTDNVSSRWCCDGKDSSKSCCCYLCKEVWLMLTYFDGLLRQPATFESELKSAVVAFDGFTPRPHIFDPKILNHVKDMWCLLQEMRIKQADLWREDVRDAIQQTAEFA